MSTLCRQLEGRSTGPGKVDSSISGTQSRIGTLLSRCPDIVAGESFATRDSSGYAISTAQMHVRRYSMDVILRATIPSDYGLMLKSVSQNRFHTGLMVGDLVHFKNLPIGTYRLQCMT